MTITAIYVSQSPWHYFVLRVFASYRPNKEYKYLFTSSSDEDKGKTSAMRDPGFLALRSNRIKRKGYEDKSCWGKCKKGIICQVLTSKKLWTVILISLIVIGFKKFIDYKIPYCTRLATDEQSGSGCSYNRVWIWDCRPCPKNAICEGGNVVSDY